MKHRTLGVGLVGTKFMGKAHSNAWMSAPRFFTLPAIVSMRAVAGTSVQEVAEFAFGIACLLAPISIPLVSVVRPQAGQPVEFTPAVLLTLALSFFLVFINARILRAAIERPMFQCVVLFLLGEFLVFAVMLVAGFGGA